MSPSLPDPLPLGFRWSSMAELMSKQRFSDGQRWAALQAQLTNNATNTNATLGVYAHSDGVLRLHPHNDHDIVAWHWRSALTCTMPWMPTWQCGGPGGAAGLQWTPYGCLMDIVWVFQGDALDAVAGGVYKVAR